MKQVLVIFENNYQLSRLFKKFVGMITNTGDVKVYEVQRAIETKNTEYKLIGAGFPYVSYEDLHPKLNSYRFDNVMIHGEVVLTRKVECYIKSRMLDSDQPFMEFEL